MSKQKNFIEALKEATAGYSIEVLKLASSQVTLSAAQATAIFEAKGLTGAELEQAVATATLSASQKSSTVAINLNTMSKIGNKEATEAEISEEIKSLLLKGKLITEEQIQAKTTVELTKAKIADAVATGNLTKAEGKQLTSTLGLTGATGGLGTAFKGLGAKIKATTASMWTFLTTTPVGWATLAVAAIGSVVAGVYAYNKAIDKAVDNAKEKLSDVASEYDEVTNAIKENNDKIKELEALRDTGNLSIVDDEDLTKLREQNEELRIRQQYLEKQKQISNQEIVEASKKKYNRDYGRQDTHNISDYKEELSNPKLINNASSYLTGEGGSQYQSSSYAAGQQDALNAENDTLAALIAQYQFYEEEKAKALQSQDSKSIEKYSSKLSEIGQKLMEDRTQLQGFLDDLSLTGESSSELDDVNYKLELIDNTLLSKGKQLVEFINDSSFKEQKEKLTELADSGKLTADILAASFPELNQYLIENGLTLEDLIGLVRTYREELESIPSEEIKEPLSISDTIDQLNTQLKPAFDSLKSAYQDIFTDDGFTLSNVDISMLDSIKSSIDSLNEMDGVEIDYSSFEDLAKVLTDTSSTSAEVRDSINVLATDIVNSLNPALKDVTGESYQLVQQMLESLGVQNAEQVMLSSLGYTYEEYTAAKQECASAGFDLANATEEEIANFIAEQGGAENCGEALALLQLKKLLLNTTRIDQTSDINNILTLAGAAGVASDSMVRLANAKTLLDNAVANNDSRGIAVAKQELIDAGKAAKDSVLDFKPVELNFSPASNTSSKGSGSKSEKDTHLEAYKKELAELEHLHNMELITDKEFYDRLRDLNEKYFNDTAEHHEKYLDEYQSNEEKIFKGLKQVYQDSLEEHKSMMDSAASHVQRVLDKEIDKLKSDSKTTIKHYEQRIDAIDKEIDAKQGIIDKYQDELDAMELANQKRKDAIALQKAQYELDRAQNQRTIGQYQNGQKVYLTDGKAVRDAEDTRDEAEYNIKRTEIQEKISLVQKEIDALEAKQDRLQAKIDQENQALDAQIEKLEAYKERWAEIAEKQTIAQEEAAFLAICGAEGEAEILAMREGILQGFSDNYDAITTNLADLAQANADRMAEIASQMEAAASRAAKAASDMAKAQASMASPKGEKYASGTKSAKRGLNLVAENKPEAIIDNDGVRLITKPTLLQMSGGEQVLNGKETETLLDRGTSLSPRIKELLSRSQIESIGNFANMNVMPSFQHNVKLPSFDFSKLQVREVTPTPVVQEINMTLPNVTNESGAQYIINTLNRLPLDTLQYSNRR